MPAKFKQPTHKVPVGQAKKLQAHPAKRFPNPDAGALTGHWINCDAKTRSVPAIRIRGRRQLKVEAWGACVPKWCEWGPAKPSFAYSESVGSAEAVAFTAEWDFGFAEELMTGHLCRGCLCVRTFTRFKDGSRRYNYHSDLCFYQVDRATWLKKTRGKI